MRSWTRREFITRGAATLSGLALSGTIGGRLISGAMASDRGRADGLTIVEDGRAVSLIVTADAPSQATREAAELLQQIILEASGARLLIVPEARVAERVTSVGGIQSLGSYSSFILLGPSLLAERLGFNPSHLGSGGILMKTQQNTLALMGRDDDTPLDPRGTHYAVTTFLEDILGVRWLWPGDKGRVIPKSASIVVPPIDYSYTPPLRQRQMRFGGTSRNLHDRYRTGAELLGLRGMMSQLGNDRAVKVGLPAQEWTQWHRLGGRLHEGSIGGHAFGHLWDKYGKDHPEWFAMNHAGSRDQSINPERSRLCKSNPGLIKAIAAECIERLDRNPTHAISLSPNDGGGNTWCVCDNCRALDAPDGVKLMYTDRSLPGGGQYEYVSLTDRVIYFWNAIADEVRKVHPQARFVVDAYSVYRHPPVRRRLRPNIVVRSVLIGYHSDEYRQSGRDYWDGWRAAGANQFWRPNLLHFTGRQGTLVNYTRRLGEDFAYFADRGMEGTDFDSIMNHWSTHGLVYYVAAKLHWDPYADVDALVDDYCRAAFGPGARYMRRYFDLVEQLTYEYAKDDVDSHDGDTSYPVVVNFTEDTIQQLKGYIDQAKSAAAISFDGDEIKERLAFVETGLEWSIINAKVYQLRRILTTGTGPEQQRARQQVKEVLDSWYWKLMDILEDEPLAVNALYVAWGSGRTWSSTFGWVRPPLEGEVEPYKYLVDPFEGPKEVAWFGTIYNPKTLAQSDGWTYADDVPEQFFGDATRKLRKENSTEYLIWETPKLDAFELIVYSKDVAVEDVISVAGSANQSAWEELSYEVETIESSPAGWFKLLVQGQVPEEGKFSFARVTLKQSPQAKEIQLGNAMFRQLR